MKECYAELIMHSPCCFFSAYLTYFFKSILSNNWSIAVLSSLSIFCCFCTTLGGINIKV